MLPRFLALVCTVFIALSPANAQYRGSLFRTDGVIPVKHMYANAVYTWIPFASVIYQKGGDDFTTPGNPAAFTIPAGVSLVVVKCNAIWSNYQNQAVGFRQLVVTKNNQSLPFASFPGQAPSNMAPIVRTTADHFTETHPIEVQQGDVLGCAAAQSQWNENGVPINILAADFSIQVLE